MIKIRWNEENIIYLILGIIVLFLVGKEAYTIPITHDEVSTIVFSHQSIWEIVTYADPIPNNHILNTLILKVSIFVFGDHAFSNRMHNILFFIPYFFFCVLIVRELFKDSWLRVAVVCMLSLQPFLLDFYSVTRGYGISVSLQVVSLYFFFKRLKSGEILDLAKCFGFAFLAVYANFTLLNYFIPLGGLLLIDTFQLNFTKHRKQFYKDILLMVAITILLMILCYLPFSKMVATKQFVYWGSTGFFNDTVKPLIISLRSGTEYFGWTNERVYAIILGLIIFAIGSSLILKSKDGLSRYKNYALYLLVLIIIYNHVQFYIADIPFLNARTALFFIPIVIINIGFGLQAWVEKKQVIGLVLILMYGGLSIQHFVRGFNIKSTYEWYFDENTFDVLRDMNHMIEEEKLEKPVKINCHWIFYPSLSYHLDRKYPGVFELVPYHKEIETNTDAVFYYTQNDEVEALSEHYFVSRDYAWKSRILLKRK